MKENLKSVLIIVLTVGFLSLLGHEMGWIGPQHIYAVERNEANYDAAYKAVIHRVWLDKPSYVEDVLWETDEMLHLDALLDGDWGDTFEFWSEKDSIDYNTNWLHSPVTLAEPDDLLPKAKPDKPSKTLPHMKIPIQ